MIRNVANTGGHLGSSLGVVELTVALHYVFEAPDDRILWDVSHQCYPHKILTGRRERMPTLRQQNGLSGFQKRKESECVPRARARAATRALGTLARARARVPGCAPRVHTHTDEY